MVRRGVERVVRRAAERLVESREDTMGKPGQNTKSADHTAEEGFNVTPGRPEVLSPLNYQGRGGGNPESPENTGLNPKPGNQGPLEPKDVLGIFDTLGSDEKSRGKRGGAY